MAHTIDNSVNAGSDPDEIIRRDKASMTAALLRTKLMVEQVRFRTHRRLFGASPLAPAADKAWTIAPPESQDIASAVCLEGQFDKAFSIDNDTSWEVERLRVFGGRVEYPAVRAWQYSDAALCNGVVMRRGRSQQIRPYGAPAPEGSFDAVRIEEGALAGSYLGLLYFGHWLRDDTTLSLMGETFGETVSPAPPDWSHVDGYLQLLDLTWRPEENASFGKLVIFDDEALTPHKAARLETLRTRARAKVTPGDGQRRIFILRSYADEGPRRLRNEAEIADALHADGFAVVDPGKVSVDEIASLMCGAELVAGLEGSHLSHAAMFLRPGGSMLAITPPGRFCTSHKRWTDLYGMRYGFTVGDPYTDGGFTASVDDIRRTVDLLSEK